MPSPSRAMMRARAIFVRYRSAGVTPMARAEKLLAADRRYERSRARSRLPVFSPVSRKSSASLACRSSFSVDASEGMKIVTKE